MAIITKRKRVHFFSFSIEMRSMLSMLEDTAVLVQNQRLSLRGRLENLCTIWKMFRKKM